MKNGRLCLPFLFVRYYRAMSYQAKFVMPFGVLGIRCDDVKLVSIDFLPSTENPQHANSAVSELVCKQLQDYLENPHIQFLILLKLDGTLHQQKVWQAMLDIPCGKTRSYGEVAAELKSAAQAVGQACGRNAIPIIIPCHRVVAKAGLGGFMQHASGDSLDIKRWLLAHEQR